jgi:hypothetical protein
MIMETYLPIIKAILSDWYLLTLANPLYAVALATLVWLLTAIIYSIRVTSLKNKNIASEKARIDTQNTLNTAQQKLQQMQEELIACTGQMETAKQSAAKEAERAARVEELLSQRNQQVAGIIQTLHTSFDLGERPVPVMGDIKAEGLWQQHDRVITLLTTRLRSEQQAKTGLQQSYQAETLKRAEKEALLETAQTTLAAQASQVAQLEQALAEQKSMLQQQQDKAQEVLSQTLEKHLAELARLTELEQQTLDLVNTRQQLTQLEEKLNAKDTLIVQLEKDKSVDQVKMPPQPTLLKQEQIETIIELPKAEEAVPPAPASIEEQAVSSVKEQARGVAGKLKSLFGSKQQTKETKLEEPEFQPTPVAVEPPLESHLKDRYGRAKYFFGGIKQESGNIKKDEAETQPAPIEAEQPPVSAVKGQLGKLKNLFGLKQQPEETQQDEDQPAPPEVEQASVSSAKGQLGKFKNLFAKKK